MDPVDPMLDTKKDQVQMPGQLIDADGQCRLTFGPKFSQYDQDLNVS